jgi:hypothetical protein
MKRKFLIKQLQRFLESLNYVTDWYPNVSKIAKPLHDRLRKNHVPWSDEHIRIVRQIKKKAQEIPYLHITNPLALKMFKIDFCLSASYIKYFFLF